MKNRHMLSKREKKEMVKKLYDMLGCRIDGKIEVGKYEKWEVFLIDGKVRGLFINGVPFLNIMGLKEYEAKKKYVVVDDGSIKYIVNGADVMAAGITDADREIKKGEVVWIKDERGNPIAIGIALMDGNEMVSLKKGRAVENIHRIGDKLWKISI